jgi:hypothetical protein
MRRGGPLERSGGLSSISPKRRGELDARKQVRWDVFVRDGHRCVLAGHPAAGACFGRLTVHHLRKSVQGGLYTHRNLVSLCVAQNDWVEDEPDIAYGLGLVARRGETIDSCWQRMAAAGLVTYWWNGDPI